MSRLSRPGNCLLRNWIEEVHFGEHNLIAISIFLPILEDFPMFEANWSLEFALFTSLLDAIQTQLDASKFALVFDLFGTFGTMQKGLCAGLC